MTGRFNVDISREYITILKMVKAFNDYEALTAKTYSSATNNETAKRVRTHNVINKMNADAFRR